MICYMSTHINVSELLCITLNINYNVMKNFILKNITILMVFLGMTDTMKSQDCTTLEVYTSTTGPCTIGEEGTILATLFEGVSPFIFTLLDTDRNTLEVSSPQNAISYFFNAPAGNYIVTVEDGNACQAEVQTTVDVFSSLDFNVISENVSCVGSIDGEIRVEVFGGFPTYDIYLRDAETYEELEFVSTADFSYVFSGLTPKSYMIEVIDAVGCWLQSDIIAISEPTELIATVINVQDVSCLGSDGAVSVEAVGGIAPYTYSLSQEGVEIVAASTNTIFNNLSTGEYLVEVVDDNSCYESITVVISNSEPLIAAVTKTDILCFPDSGQIVVEAIGGTPPYRYSINDGALLTTNIFTGLVSGVYTINTLDNLDCNVINEVTIEEPFPLLLFFEKEIDYISESDNTITTSVVGGVLPFRYELIGANIEFMQNDTGVFNQIPMGEYTLGVIDGVDCTITETLVISYGDTNNDGISDNDEDVNSNGTLSDDDTDGDGIPDYQDDDDDNDGVDSAGEIDASRGSFSKAADNFLDTDEDGLPNHRDTDDDGDGILTIDEDYNGNGDPTDDDTDGSGVADYLEKEVTLSVEENELSNRFSFFPNPASSNVVMEFNTMGGVFIEVTFFDINGAKIATKKEVNTNQSIRFDVSSFSTGIYFVQIYDGSNYGIKKLFIK